MRRLITVAVLLFVVIVLASCNQPDIEEIDTQPTDTDTATEALTDTEKESDEGMDIITDRVIEKTVLSPYDSTAVLEDSAIDMTYKNPLLGYKAKNAWGKNYGFGDPFVMRYNGRYYMYCSTLDGEIGIKCWTSDDLNEWTYVGLCAEEKLTKTAYAPEVVYYNGAFYMYTSPAGNGHYVLKSDSPTGPFTAITDNFGLSIDGDVFIDDDGSWHFYSASSSGIMAYEMSAPDKIDADSGVKTGSYMNGWTEGSMIIKYNDIYYMTYTGNHVWADGYRIDYSVSTEGPTKFTPASNNPVLLSTDKSKVKGIGHSSTVLSPDLDGYYIVYHSAVATGIRRMNMDRIVLNGESMWVLGPTVTPQQSPSMPTVYSYFESEEELAQWNVKDAIISDPGRLSVSEGGYAIAKTAFEDIFTAEINLLSVDGCAGAYFEYKDADNYASLGYDSQSHTLTVTFTQNGESEVLTADISGSFDEELRNDALILITIRRGKSDYQFLVNNRMAIECESTLDGGSFGVAVFSGSASFGFVGISSEAMQSSAKSLYKPIEGILPAITCIENDITVTDIGGIGYLSVSEGQTYNYRVNVSERGEHDLTVVYRSNAESELEIYQNGTLIGSVSLSDTGKAQKTALMRGIPLSDGISAITFKVSHGSADILCYEFYKAEDAQAMTVEFTADTKPAFSDGKWEYSDGTLTLVEECGKWLIGSEDWRDYTAQADITPLSDNINFGMIVRTVNPSNGGAGKDANAGTDFLQGYFVGFTADGVCLGKHNYNWQHIKSAPAKISVGTSYNLKVEVKGMTIKIWLDGVLMIEYTDSDPFICGRAGFRGCYSSARVNNFSITPIVE